MHKCYIGVNSISGNGIFYFNIERLSALKFVRVKKDSRAWIEYLEYCERNDVIPVNNAFYMTVGHSGGQVHFLISKKKMKQVKHRMANYLCHEDDLEEE
jgi:hypothetical protein